MSLSDVAHAHIALAHTADAVVADFTAKMAELAASERGLRSAYVAEFPGQANFAQAGQAGLANYMITLAQRLLAGEPRAEFLQPVGALAAAAWLEVIQ